MTRGQLWLACGILVYSGLVMLLYRPRKGDFKPGMEPRFEGDEADGSRYSDAGLLRKRRGRWMGWLSIPYTLLLARLTGIL